MVAIRILGAWLRAWLWLAIAFSAAALILLHMFDDGLRIDAVSAALLGVVLISPYLPLVRRIRLGEFEAELGPEEVARAEREVEIAAPEASSPPGGSLKELSDELMMLVGVDPPLALAKLRIEMENILVQLLRAREPEQKHPRRGIRAMVNDLHRMGVLDGKTQEAVTSLTDVLNRAVHGADVSPDHADRIIATGIRLLDHFGDLLAEATEPQEVQMITPGEEEAAARAIYRVVTVVPYVGKPEKRTYVMTQDQLDGFLEGYDEYAEYIVSVEPHAVGNESAG